MKFYTHLVYRNIYLCRTPQRIKISYNSAKLWAKTKWAFLLRHRVVQVAVMHSILGQLTLTISL